MPLLNHGEPPVHRLLPLAPKEQAATRDKSHCGGISYPMRHAHSLLPPGLHLFQTSLHVRMELFPESLHLLPHPCVRLQSFPCFLRTRQCALQFLPLLFGNLPVHHFHNQVFYSLVHNQSTLLFYYKDTRPSKKGEKKNNFFIQKNKKEDSATHNTLSHNRLHIKKILFSYCQPHKKNPRLRSGKLQTQK